jgi:membrane associated rhomboid family serine protease
MRPWYKYSEKNDDFIVYRITPFSKIWGFGAPVTISLVAVNSAIWLLMVTTNALHLLNIDTFWYAHFAMIPSMVVRGHIYQIVTNIFLHSWDFLHVLFNMYLLWMFGPRVERTFSSRMFLVYYLVAGIAGSLLSLGMRLVTGDPLLINSPSLGASGAVFGVIVAYGFLFSKDRLLLFFVYPIEAWKAVVGFIVLESLFVIFGFMPNVDHWAHLGGAAAGAIWMLVLIKVKGNKTDHGWYQARSRNPETLWSGYSQPKSPRQKIRIIYDRPTSQQDEHPEGTDDEPPPDWFKI